ncbi:c-type cytochrome [Roseivivax sediminis]|uniref:Cytochrome c2 n=1 Tax=Roseivivax sediminis TaxID=936889 RepID=A0A1I2AVX9_9RHOB|nr:cytochrome c family protein [Roseivivax sediminis]SFE47899.1 Cytochrome c2 [Roseivivax sediminis]
MFDTMTFTKVVGGFCGTFLVFLLGKWAAEGIYHVGIEAHGDEEVHAAYVIDTGSEEGGGEEEQTVDFASLWAEADAGAGERVFNQCRACHQLEEGANAVGPYLYGVVGRDIGAAEGFSYSGALSEQDADVWNPETLFAFLENPSGWAPGTSMSYSGLSDGEDRVNLIAYLNEHGGNAEVGVTEGGSDEAAASEEGGDTEEAAASEGNAEGGDTEQSAESEGGAEGGEAEQAADSEGNAEGGEAEQAAGSEGGETEQAAGSEGGEGSAILANADAEAGERVFNKCRACHKLDGSDGVGPHLNGVVGRDVGAAEGFNYSGALKEAADVWTPENLDAFLENPRGFASGTKMSFAGLRSEEERANVIAYLNSVE